MNKIKNVLKVSPIIAIVASLVTVGVASAALVNYLSNATQATTTVTSPITMSVNEGRNGTETNNSLISITTTGGSDFIFTTVAKNNANNAINGYPVIVAVAPSGQNFTGGEVTKVMFENAAYPYPTGLNITSNLYVVYSDGSLHALSTWTGNSQKLVLFFDNGQTGTPPTGYSLPAGAVDWNVLTMTLNSAITPGTYQIYAQYVANLATYATAQYANL